MSTKEPKEVSLGIYIFLIFVIVGIYQMIFPREIENGWFTIGLGAFIGLLVNAHHWFKNK